ncbi:hypothetical protein MLD38_025825 [Melastoma candidum]|uniref:Uncharacterized protein n=1 Tax=Melastoma candidum TaxID=119954 RepID=A0ACB9NWB9_9MYRT|nr:hypothetical protein MLD38_025825 [Melastoma candidum]
MVRFSCFNGHLTGHKSKKVATSSAESGVPSTSQNLARNPTSFKDFSLIERGWKYDDLMKRMDVGEIRRLKKSQSLESGLQNKGKSIVDQMDNDTDGAFSDEIVGKRRLMTMEENASSPPSAGELPPKLPIFSIEELHTSENGKHENYDADVPLYHAGEDSGDHTPRTPPLIVRPRSLPNMGASSPVSMGYSREFGQRSRSSEDLLILGMRQNETSNYELKMQLRPQDGGAYDDPNTGNQNDGDDDGYPNAGYHVESGDRIVPAEDELPKSLQEVGLPLDDSPGKDFRFKRIQKWVIDLEPCIPSEVVDESFQTNDETVSDHTIIDGIDVKAVMKVSPGMESAKRYISSLSSSAATCQLGNHGLEVIPFLSAFVSLKVVNLSGNNIARITAGALPRGLHALNLSRNRISTIEGLRELTRLRVLDLSYNRIFRIGHGLASCSSLKELYLAGNKISEVEGLHRLLKLNVLDLRFNKISTAKCLGQLAANYNSLQAISLEGNPAQKNVGDEQLKKNVQGLLPHLAYYNKQNLKVSSTLKDSSERAVRLGSSSSYQFDRNLRSDAKTLKKGGQSVVTKPGPSSHSRRSQAATLSSKTKHSRLPPIATRPTSHHQSQQYYFDLGEKLRSLKPDLFMHRSRSEGTLGVL